MHKALLVCVLTSSFFVGAHAVHAAPIELDADIERMMDFRLPFDETWTVGAQFFRHAGNVYAIHSYGDTFYPDEDYDTASDPLTVSVATDNTLTTWEDATHVGPFASFNDTVFEVEWFMPYNGYIYASVLNTHNRPELWRLQKDTANAVWERVGADVFSGEVTSFHTMVVRPTIRSFYTRRVEARAAVFLVGHTDNGNHLYRSRDGVHWQRMNPNGLFVGDDSTQVMGLAKHTVEAERLTQAVRYVYAVQKDGGIIRAPMTNMNQWEEVFQIAVTNDDLDSPNPDIEVTSTAKNDGKLYVAARVLSDDGDGAVLVSADWETASTIQEYGSVPYAWKLKKFHDSGELYVLATGSQGWGLITRILPDDSIKYLVETNAAGPLHDERLQFTSMMQLNGITYFSYRTTRGPVIYSLAETE